ncbi:MAG: peptide chain release factor N(5)-glutamine methyltransferase [Flavobacteriaceae bacterium]|nr:peptide chain release factor N(5)-glutamine methyltransferase [Flavobacteriaceae bacterium]
MTLREYREHFTNTFSNLYPKTEIDSIFFLLLEEYLNLKRIDFTLNPNEFIKDAILAKLKALENKLLKEEPIQYIIGKTEFYGLPFLVNKHILIPRPETEELVEWIIQENINQNFKILDIGTGSGCIAISLAKHLQNAKVTAIDISKEALDKATENASLNNVSITFKLVDVLKTETLDEKFDVIVSNPPYVRELEKSEIKNNVLNNEPHTALFVSNSNPLVFYDKIADLAKKSLTKNGLLFFEINQYLGKETVTLLSDKGFKNIILKRDLFKNHRMIRATL